MLNLSVFLEDSARSHPDRDAVVLGDLRLTYAQVNGFANQVANLLVSRGIGPGDKVALSCPNLPYFPIVYYGILKAGATVVPLNVLLKGREIAYHLEDSDAKAYFCFEGTPDLPMGQMGHDGFSNAGRCEHFFMITADMMAPSPIEGTETMVQALGGHADTFESVATEATDQFDITSTLYYTDFHRNWYKLGSVLGSSIGDVLADPDGHAAEMGVLEGGASADDALLVRANNRTYVAQGVQSILGLRWNGAGTHEAEIGIRYHQDEEDRFQHDDRYRMVAGRMELTSAGAPGSQANRVSEARAWSAFVQDQIALGRWTVTPGVRFESIDFTRTDYAGTDPDRSSPSGVRENDVTAWIPGLGVAFERSPGVTFFGGVHRGLDQPWFTLSRD